MSFFTKKVGWSVGQVLGALTLIVAIVPAIITVLNYNNSPKSELSVDVYYTDVIWPQALQNHFDDVYSLTSKYPLKDIMFDKEKELTPEEATLVEKTSSFYKGQLEQNIPFRLFWIQTAWKVVIKNTGTVKVSPFTLSIPRMSHFEVVNKAGGKQPYFNFTDIPVGELLANDEITIHAWGGQVYKKSDGSPLLNIAHDGASIKYAEHKYLKEEYRDELYDYVYLQIAFGLLILFLYIIAKLSGIYSIKIAKREKE